MEQVKIETSILDKGVKINIGNAIVQLPDTKLTADDALDELLQTYGSKCIVKHFVASIRIAAQSKKRSEYRKGGHKTPTIDAMSAKWFDADPEGWKEAAAEGAPYLATCATRWYDKQPKTKSIVPDTEYSVSDFQD
jgi:hypothetical protein